MGVTSNKNRKKQYNPYPPSRNNNHAISHIQSIVEQYLPIVLADYDVEFSSTKRIVMGSSMGGLMSIKTSILYPTFSNIISFSPAFWYGYTDFINDLKNLNKKTICNISVGSEEGEIFEDKSNIIKPAEWGLDYTNNNDFYVSGVKKIEKELKLNNIKTNFVFKEKGQHNETHWNPILREFLVSI